MAYIEMSDDGFVLYKEDNSTETIRPPYDVMICATGPNKMINISRPGIEPIEVQFRPKHNYVDFQNTFLPPQTLAPKKAERDFSKPTLDANMEGYVRRIYQIDVKTLNHRDWMVENATNAYKRRAKPLGGTTPYQRLRMMLTAYSEFYHIMREISPGWVTRKYH